MHLGKAGWLAALLNEAVKNGGAGQSIAPHAESARGLSGRGEARARLRPLLRESGLLYGTPALDSGGAMSTTAPEEVLFLAVLRALARVALELGRLAGPSLRGSPERLLVLFALFGGDVPLATEIDKRLRPGAKVSGEVVPKKLWQKVEDALNERAMSLSGDPVYGLVLHNGAVYADAQAFGRQAIDYFARGTLRKTAAERRIEYAERQKFVLVEVLAALACAERPPSFPARRAILRQIEDLALPSKLESELKNAVRKFFEKRPKLEQVVRGARSADVRRFILEQTLLSSLVDGRRSPKELAFIRELAGLFAMSKELRQIEVEMAEFYAKNREVVDVFTVAAGAEVMGEEMVESMQRTLRKNFQALMTEIRETGELSVLLTRAARGQSLSSEERRKMREQLIDMAKAIPALAIFAAPGGVLLLIALAKVLPFSLLPSAFQDRPEDETPVE